ncbi:hypothetical protein SAY87_030630 [Trapa incisa]|uniref:BZIP domain-containing protein n=1 Tax=Trapa incisa TaxID=236973 RepID=A0AAN7KJ32_9MYRT|nr:hypothetical protein SAY87_030630 [Trapa incisa]
MSSLLQIQVPETVKTTPGSSSSSSHSPWKRQEGGGGAVSFPRKSKIEEVEEDLFTVPDVEARPSSAEAAAASASNSSATGADRQGKRRRGRNPVDKEYKRLKRLLRNRVSAQQARERKKVYVNDLEERATELQDRNSKLEEEISTLINENTMLRKILMNTRPKPDECAERKQ